MRDLQAGRPTPLTNLKNAVLAASDVLASLSYEDCCTARELIRDLQFKAIRGVAERYDAADEGGFGDLVQVAIGLFPDQREAARQLGASVSTINRWKNGTTIPHPLVRVSIQGAILKLLDAEATALPTLFGLRACDDRAVARTLTH